MKLFSIDSPVYKFMQRLTDVFVLNFWWILCSLPIITIGVSTIAACDVSIKMNEEREGKITRQFFKSFKANLKQGLIMSIISIICVIAVYLDFCLYNAVEENAFIFLIIGSISAYIFFFSLIYSFPLLARYKNTIFQTLRNSFRIGMKYFIRTLILLFIVVIEIGLIFWNEVTLIFGVILGPAIIIYTVSGMAIKIFREIEKQPDAVSNPEVLEKENEI